MAVDASRWRVNACEIIGSVADENFQRDAWFGEGRFISSPEEIYNQVFSDLAFEEFISSPEIALNDLQRAAANKLVSKMNYFEKIVGRNWSPENVIDHPVGREIRQVARQVRRTSVPSLSRELETLISKRERGARSIKFAGIKAE